MKSPFTTATLANGLRIIHTPSPTSVVYCGYAIDAGTRDEQPHESGLAHFVEHMLFKGTTRRRAWHILNRMENVGGDLNAFTNKEETVVYSAFLKKDFTRALELLTDIVFHSTFPQHEIDKERGVVLEEIDCYEDSPAELIFDDFEDILFHNHALGHNILGTKAALMRHDGDAIRRFIERTHTTDQMVFSTIGNLSLKAVQSVAERYFGQKQPSKRRFERVRPLSVEPFEKLLTKHTHQVHCIVGARAYDIHAEKRLPLALLINILGGPSANSRLNILLREKNGLSYNIEANYTPYNDCGMVAMYFSCDHHNVDHCRELIDKELRELRSTLLSARRMAMTKRQFLAQMAISMENNEGYMLGAGKSFLVHDEIDTLEEVYRKVSAVSAEQIRDVAEEIFSHTSTLIYQ